LPTLDEKLNFRIAKLYIEQFISNSDRTRGPESIYVNSHTLDLEWTLTPVSDLWQLIMPSTDIDEDNLVSEKIGGMEHQYGVVVDKILRAARLGKEELIHLSFVVLTLLTNAGDPKYLKRGSEEVIEGLTWENFESAVSGARKQGERKRSSLSLPEGDLLDHGMHFILNRTKNPFITSDRALFVDSWVSKEGTRIFGPLGVLDQDVYGATERVIILPLSPQAAVVSSSFISRHYKGLPYIDCSSSEIIFELNLLACYAAERFVLASRAQPFGEFETRARKTLSANRTEP
jgi:hypothetical protein